MKIKEKTETINYVRKSKHIQKTYIVVHEGCEETYLPKEAAERLYRRIRASGQEADIYEESKRKEICGY